MPLLVHAACIHVYIPHTFSFSFSFSLYLPAVLLFLPSSPVVSPRLLYQHLFPASCLCGVFFLTTDSVTLPSCAPPSLLPPVFLLLPTLQPTSPFAARLRLQCVATEQAKDWTFRLWRQWHAVLCAYVLPIAGWPHMTDGTTFVRGSSGSYGTAAPQFTDPVPCARPRTVNA